LPYRKEGLADIIQPAVDLFTKWKMELEPKLKQEALKTVIEQQKQAEALRHNQAAEAGTARASDILEARNRHLAKIPVNLGGGMAWDEEGGTRRVGPFNVPAGGTAILPEGGGGGGGGYPGSLPLEMDLFKGLSLVDRPEGSVPPALSQLSGGAPPSAGMPGLQSPGAPPALNTFTAPKEPQSFNLSPGGVRYDASGKVVASAPMTPSQKHVPGGGAAPTTAQPVAIKDKLGNTTGWASWNKKTGKWDRAPGPEGTLPPKRYNATEIKKGTDFLNRSGNTEDDLWAAGWDKEAIAQAKAGMQKKAVALPKTAAPKMTAPPQKQAMASMPPAGKHKGKVIKDTATGKRLKSDGKVWRAI
jgi:hypothetical protein